MRRSRRSECWLTLPSLLWLALFFLLPTLMVFSTSFRPADPYGGLGSGWTLETLARLYSPNYPAIIWRTLWLSAVTTLICLLVAVPVAYTLARARQRFKRLLLLLVVLPFWTNFLIRIFAWKVLLHPEGLVKQGLLLLGLVAPEASLMYCEGAVLLVLVYTYLPFAILPVYAAAERFDFGLLEAAQDLGARPWRAFCTVFLPGVRRGLLAAALVVFIPALGSYVIPDIMGGPASEMLGNKIAQRVFVDRNLPQASALSALLTLAVMVPLLLALLLNRKRPEEPVALKEGA
ncbi:ABC transporter permease [Desulfuromonas thiophila]|jgi:spermidine/putrescine transport system permease protein|uniref:Spermidine/putrescine transport system permease protein n=1 Tax=Desulfuromonas thiophila TaxID=57664 RepID=A0A1G6X9D2_9BACT|nr:ABC transporter permease [Desulfuromonas thiophila]MDD3801608.1 ABC transporter permease [Desulfuromonas thiophila]MDY0399032.1 ABC transporter permease [Desulfuromonas thiophila]SDD74443.1 spermidine/putrescine transport system permease protein [Desulfuromonas thiophila]